MLVQRLPNDHKQVALHQCRGGALNPALNAEKSGCFRTRDAMQGYDVVLYILA
jgi:hypothetical protein